MILESGDVLRLLGPDNDDHTNTLPLQLCSAILYSFDASQKGLTHDFNSPLVLDFKDALLYFLDKIYDLILFPLRQRSIVGRAIISPKSEGVSGGYRISTS